MQRWIYWVLSISYVEFGLFPTERSEEREPWDSKRETERSFSAERATDEVSNPLRADTSETAEDEVRGTLTRTVYRNVADITAPLL